MANPIAEAFVELRPDLTGFSQQLQSGVNQAIRNLKVPANVQNQIGTQMFGPGFVQQAQTGTTNALKNTKVPTTTQRTLAQNLFGSAFRTESGRALQGALVGLGGGQLAAQAAFFGPGGAAVATLGLGLSVAAKSAITFEQALEVLRATTQASDADMKRAADTALELGDRLDLPGVTATDSAVAITELAKAGLTLEDSFAGAEGVLRLAIAAGIDTGSAAQIAAAGLNAFSLAGDKAAHVADLLAGASIAAQGDVGDMALALQQSAAVASQAGLSIEQLVGLITALARQGILGSDAGTSIRTMLLRLVPTTKEAAAEMERLGVQLDQTRTIGQQLPEVIEQYRRGLALLTPIQRQAALQQIFGTDAIRSATVAFSQGAVGIQAATDAANRNGAAAELTEARTKGAAGALRNLQSEAQNAGLELGQNLTPAIEAVANTAAAAIDGIVDFSHAIAEMNRSIEDQLGLPSTSKVFSISGLDIVHAALGVAQDDLARVGVDIGKTDEAADHLGATFEELGSRVTTALSGIQIGLGAIPQQLRIVSALGITPAEFNRIITETRQRGQQAGFALGKTLMDATASGITANEQRAIDAAKQSLADIQTEGQKRIIESIRSARSNLESLGSTLADALGEAIDAGPIGDRLDELNRQLDALEERTSRRELRFNTSQAQQDLREAQEAIAQVGKLTPAQKKSQNEFLEPFREKVAGAKADIKKFDLSQAITQQEELRDAAKKTAEEGLAKLVDEFENGKISAGEFTTLLNRQLAPALQTIRRENLGLSFERGFLRDVQTLVDQVKKLAPFIGTPGTTPGPQAISPKATQDEVNRAIAQAQVALAQAIQDANSLTKQELEKHDREIALLRQIVQTLRPTSKSLGVGHQ